MEKFGVDIKFSGGETENTVTIEGNEQNVEECKEHLLELAEEMMDTLMEKYVEFVFLLIFIFILSYLLA